MTGDTHPDHDTIAFFRRRNQNLFLECFVKALAMAQKVRSKEAYRPIQLSPRSALGRAIRKMSVVESAAIHECTQKIRALRITA